MARFLSLCVVVLTLACTIACTKNQSTGNGGGGPSDGTSSSGTITISTTAFASNQPIPAKHTAEGEDVSPPLTWTGAPEGTVSFALICDDPDAPSPEFPNDDPWVHWVIYNIPGNVNSLPEGIAREVELTTPITAKQGVNSWNDNNVGYRGPEPPKGTGAHRYFFKLYALDKELSVAGDEVFKHAVEKAMQGHVLAEGSLIGTYEVK